MTDTMPDNPRAIPGSNQAPDYAREVTNRMAQEYAATVADVEKLLKQAADLVAEVRASGTGKVEDDATSLRLSKVYKDIGDKSDSLKAYHDLEKQPFLRGGQGVDNFFFGWMEKLARRKPTDKAGAADILYAFVDDFTQRKLAIEQAKRDEDERKAREVAQEAQRAREAEEQRQRDAVAAAARARKPETVAAHQAIADEASGRAAVAAIQENTAREQLTEAQIAATAKPADLVRSRSDEGVLTSMGRDNVATMIDASKLDPVALWPFVKDQHKQMALTAWAKITQFKKPMDGALITQKNKTVIR